MNESELIKKLRRIEALHARPGTDGEKLAAEAAIQRLTDRLLEEKSQADELADEYSFAVPDQWRRQLLMALMRKYGIQPYRYHRQRHTTVRARVAKRFLDETLWPQYEAMSRELYRYLEQATSRIITEAVHADSSEATVVADPKQLSFV